MRRCTKLKLTGRAVLLRLELPAIASTRRGCTEVAGFWMKKYPATLDSQTWTAIRHDAIPGNQACSTFCPLIHDFSRKFGQIRPAEYPHAFKTLKTDPRLIARGNAWNSRDGDPD